MKTKAYAVQTATTPLVSYTIERREPRPEDVLIEILYCGICHSDIHAARNEWGRTQYPFVPGHEIIGRVSAVGTKVSSLKVGDMVGVGCMVDSCRHCASCDEGFEQYCDNGFTGTWNAEDKIGGTAHKVTLGGYSDKITVDARYVLRIPANLDPAAAAPLLCAGITTYSPLRHWKVGPGQKIGIIGLGGLGHMGVKFAHAMGAHVVMITTSPEKGDDAKKLGAHEVLISKNEVAMQAAQDSFDFLLNTIPVGHDVDPYSNLLKRDGVMVIVGSVEPLTKVNSAPLIFRRRTIAGSLIGGIAETQEMLDFCGEHNITCEIEKIAINDVNTAFDRTVKGDVKYRFVIDMATLKTA
ncbi:putative zinc-type alcohol dehydrogenase-like protein YahK [Legionella massiliensis]|uniref:Putative zinc-type alcohol dehydrogenase-like protein YahK n=1 Tax=Legionella massiliensis TaxID=1034943 RepID=A0A078KXP7_9GAMM|nr:NAD(P)-dependent alcohol dehydrogenase [Legionella massiliensis]CDZ77802.1 putative zinc-type alcohol dehydrogenase-like protein YahK [Legionella massiliensis]CEE13540.1 Aldehyde reductase YahK [Legionella massiliensis]